MVLAFQSEPRIPPSTARRLAAQQPTPTALNYYHSVKRIMTNRDYILLLLTYGINVGVFYAMSTLLNQVVLQHFPVKTNFIDYLISPIQFYRFSFLKIFKRINLGRRRECWPDWADDGGVWYVWFGFVWSYSGQDA